MKIGYGQDSHRFETQKGTKACIIGGIEFLDAPGLDADSDGDIVYHALCNAITSITHVHIMGDLAIKMCKSGITDSKEYLLEAKKALTREEISHIAIAITGKQPRLQSALLKMRENIAEILELNIDQVGITCTSSNNLDDCGLGLGLSCTCLLTIS